MSTYYYNKEETIKRHREMWNWIADQVESGTIYPDTFPGILSLKAKAIRTLFPEDVGMISSNCYLCDYAYYESLERAVTNMEKKCRFCPLGYGETTTPGGCLNGIYGNLLNESITPVEFVRLAREIANLPERNFSDD